MSADTEFALAGQDAAKEVLAEKVKRLAVLNVKLSGVDALIQEKTSLLAELSRLPIEQLLAAAAPVYVTNGSTTKGERKKRETAMGAPDEKVWAAIKAQYFKKGKEAKIDATARKTIAAEQLVDVGVVNGTLAHHCNGQFAGPYAGAFTLKS